LDANGNKRFARRLFAFGKRQNSNIIANTSSPLFSVNIMKKSWLSLPVIFLAANAALSQTVRSVPTPTPSDDVVKISTNLIQIDVSVTDKDGKPIRDLRQDEIEVYENGEKQKISNFSFVNSAPQPAESPKTEQKASPGVPVPPTILRPEQVHRTIALVVDDLSLSFESAYYTRRALKKYVDEQMQPGDLVAIIRTGAGIGALQQFTSDKQQLYAAINRVVWNPIGNGGISAFAPIGTVTADTTDNQADSLDSKSTFGTQIDSVESFRESVFATGTLGALRYVVQGMSELPGRKSVVMFSDGFKLFETDQNGNKFEGRVIEFLRQLVDLANRSSVVFYTVDARGLQYTGPTAADDMSGSSMADVISQRSNELLDTQEGLSYLAYETGGLVFKNNNDLSSGVRRVLEDQSYYLVGYEPDTDTFDPAKRKFNQLTVRVSRPGARVRYRSGFFNVADRAKPSTAAAAEKTPGQQMVSALISPFAVNGLRLHLNALFGSDPRIGSYVRSLIHINAADLKFTDGKDGTKTAVFDVLAMSFGDNGQVVDELAKTYSLTIKPENLERIIRDGFVYYFVFPVKKPGAYQYRVAIRDEGNAKVGSATQFIQVPDTKKKRVTLSSIVIQALASGDWEKAVSQNGGVPANPLADTALRRVRAGTVLRYGYEIYNAKLGPDKMPVVTTQVRVFHDGKSVLDGKIMPLNVKDQKDVSRLMVSGAVTLGRELAPGDYVLQVIVTDTLAKQKERAAVQYLQFEVVQ